MEERKYKSSVNREENTFTLTDAELKKSSYRKFKDGKLLFWELALENFAVKMQVIAKQYAAEGLNIMIEIGNQKRILIFS
jgi:hypothetical protein